MKVKFLIIAVFVCMSFSSIKAQKAWTLQECIDYTLENNLSLRFQALDVDDKGLLSENAKNQRLPSLTADLSFVENFNQSNTSTNTYVKGNSFNAGFSVNAGMTLFSGFAIKNAISRTNLEHQAAEFDLEKRKDDVLLLLLQSYLDILLKKEIVIVADQQLAITRKAKEVVKIKYEVGEMSKDVYLENLAQEARETAALEEAVNALNYARLVMAHILDLKDPELFDVVVPQLPDLLAKVSVYNASSIYESAKLIRPEVKRAEKLLEGSKYLIKESESGYYPTVSIFSGFNTSYYNFHKLSNQSLADQLEFASRPFVGLRISVPIFSKFSNNTNVKRAKLNFRAQDIELQRVENQLRQNVKEAYVLALSAQAKYESANKTLEATIESFRFADEKYKVGSISPYDYNTAKSQLTKAESEYLQSKYQFIFSAKVLDFYKGETVVL